VLVTEAGDVLADGFFHDAANTFLFGIAHRGQFGGMRINRNEQAEQQPPGRMFHRIPLSGKN
jgi:hypothetical protein